MELHGIFLVSIHRWFNYMNGSVWKFAILVIIAILKSNMMIHLWICGHTTLQTNHPSPKWIDPMQNLNVNGLVWGKFTGNKPHISWDNLWSPVYVPSNQSMEHVFFFSFFFIFAEWNAGYPWTNGDRDVMAGQGKPRVAKRRAKRVP